MRIASSELGHMMGAVQLVIDQRYLHHSVIKWGIEDILGQVESVRPLVVPL